MYIPYTLQISRFCALMKTAKKNKKLSLMISTFQRECAAKGLPSFDLESMASLPYTHLHSMSEHLNAVVVNTSQDDPGLENINRAADRLSQVLDMVDEAKRESEQIKVLMKMKESLPEVTDLLDGSREFVFNGNVTLKNMEVKRKDKNTYGLQVGQQYIIYLFSDIIIFTTLKKKFVARFSLNDVSPAAAATVPASSLAVPFSSLAPQRRSKTMFHLICLENFYSFSSSCAAAWTKTLSETIDRRRRTRMFGVTLEDIMSRPQEASSTIPHAIETVITYIRDHGLTTDGIFRKAGSFPEITRYKNRMDAGKMIYFTDPLTAAAVLKTWLRELADPLLTSALYSDWLAAGDKQKRLDSCIARLPTLNLYLLAEILRLVQDVMENARYNKMTAENLAVVLGPVTLYDTSAQVDLSKCSQTISLFVTLVKNADKIIKAAKERSVAKPKRQRSKSKVRHDGPGAPANGPPPVKGIGIVTAGRKTSGADKDAMIAPKSARGTRKCSIAGDEHDHEFAPKLRTGTPISSFDLSKSEETSEDGDLFKL